MNIEETEKKAKIRPQKWVTGHLTVQTSSTKTSREALFPAYIDHDHDQAGGWGWGMCWGSLHDT